MRRVIVQILLVSFSFVFLNAQGTFKSNGIIALITDYGTKDFYTGALKGSILKINPQANVVDITHEITPFNIREGMFNLFLASQEYPKGTIFIASINSSSVSACSYSQRNPCVLPLEGFIQEPQRLNCS